MTNNKKFFDEQTEQSAVKSAIVSKYFFAWANVIMSNSHVDKIAYLDLFAGPGRYKDGAKSTPILILEKAIADNKMRNMLMTIFNDADSDKSSNLEKSINAIVGIERLRYPPVMYNHEVGEEMVKIFDTMRSIPTLFFVDPWGYKGLSLRLINSVLKNWGCDCIFFFNYNRISMGLSNPVVKEHMDALFGERRADVLRKQIELLKPMEKELTIVEAIATALKEMGGHYVLPFGFKNEQGSRTSHHLIFVSKHPLGYKIMKEIMAKESSSSDQGVPSFEYSPADKRQPLLFSLSRPLEALEQDVLTTFAGCCISFKQLYDEHNVDTRYVEKNYKEVLRKLEEAGIVHAEPPATKRVRKGEVTVGDKVLFTFPKR